MNEGISIRAKLTELSESYGWYYKDLFSFIVIPVLGMTIVLAALWFFKEQLYVVFAIDTYLVWHNIFEFSSVVVSFAIFILSWWFYGQLGNRRDLFVGWLF